MSGPEFITVPFTVLTDRNIGHAAKLLYGRLRLYAGKNGKAYPKHKRLGEDIGLAERQVRYVLMELRAAGWIDWSRSRTSCVYTIFQDRQKTADQARQDIADLAAEKCRSRSAEKCQQKIGFEVDLHHQGFENGSSVKASVVVGEPETPDSNDLTGDDDPEAEFRKRMTERHPFLDAIELLSVVQAELDGVSLTRFLEVDGHCTTAPESLRNPIGHYRKLARKVRNSEMMAQSVPVVASAPRPPEPPRDGHGRCSLCAGTGVSEWAPTKVYCKCVMGAEVARADRGIAADRAKAPASAVPAIEVIQ